MTTIRSVTWETNRIILLDQQKLPHETVFITLNTIQDVWDAIYQLKVRGAPAIGITAAFGLAIWATQHTGTSIVDFKKELQTQRDFLASSRPTAVNLFWAIDRVVKSVEHAQNVDRAKETIILVANEIHKEDESVCRQIGENAFELFKENDKVMTICNAGGIATAKYGTALAPFYIAKERGVNLEVFACETRPVLQGARLTAWELQQAGVDVTLITDNMAAYTIQAKDVQAIIVGADRIAANGDTANKIGTFGLAVLAKSFNIPFYVAAPLSTFDPAISSGKDIPIEERHADEVTHLNGQRIAPEGVKVFNPAFDVTPGELISAIITEKGILSGNYNEEIARIFQIK